MSKLFDKIKFYFRKPAVVVVAGSARKTAAEAIVKTLSPYFKVGKEVLIFETDLQDSKDFEFMAKQSRLPILVVTHIGEYHHEREFFAGEQSALSEITELAKKLPVHGRLILNYDDETVRDMQNQVNVHFLTFGFGARANVRAGNIFITQFPVSGLPALPGRQAGQAGTNFKINYENKIVPVWLEKLFGKEHIYAALAGTAVGSILGLNLVEISSALRFYKEKVAGLTDPKK